MIHRDKELWREVRHTALDMGITATQFFEQALRNELESKEGKEEMTIARQLEINTYNQTF
jgi:hypothetical protein